MSERTERGEQMEAKSRRLFNSRRILYGDSMEDLANYLGIARQSLYLKVSGEFDFKQDEMFKIKERYNLTDKEFVEIFKKDGD